MNNKCKREVLALAQVNRALAGTKDLNQERSDTGDDDKNNKQSENNSNEQEGESNNGESGGGDPVSGGIFAASVNITMLDERLNSVYNTFKSLQLESNALGLGLDYTSELTKVGNILKTVRFVGYGVGVAGVIWDGYNTFGNNPTMSVGKFSLNATMTAVGFIGIPGAIISGIYFGVDTFVPGGWGTVSKNQYNMYMMHVQDGVMMSPWLIGK